MEHHHNEHRKRRILVQTNTLYTRRSENRNVQLIHDVLSGKSMITKSTMFLDNVTLFVYEVVYEVELTSRKFYL